MYSLKVVNKNCERTSFYHLGGEFHIQRPMPGDPLLDGMELTVSGEMKGGESPLNVVIFKAEDAYIVNPDGKTIEVVNRAGWHE